MVKDKSVRGPKEGRPPEDETDTDEDSTTEPEVITAPAPKVQAVGSVRSPKP